MVKIYLPRINGSDRPERNDLFRVSDPDAKNKRVLVVEDDGQFRETVSAQLSSEGYCVISAKDGPDAIELLKGPEHIDVLLTDVVLPKGINGRKLADLAVEMRPEISVIYMSGYSENAIIHHGRLDQGITLIQKPFRKADLIREIVKATQS